MQHWLIIIKLFGGVRERNVRRKQLDGIQRAGRFFIWRVTLISQVNVQFWFISLCWSWCSLSTYLPKVFDQSYVLLQRQNTQFVWLIISSFPVVFIFSIYQRYVLFKWNKSFPNFTIYILLNVSVLLKHFFSSSFNQFYTFFFPLAYCSSFSVLL